MRTENINRKFKLHDERRIAAQLPEQLHGLDVIGFGKLEEFPGELLNSFGEFANGSVSPRSRIYRNAQPNLIDAWLLELLRGARIGDRFYLRTGLEYFPWADCRVLDHRWLESLRRVMGTNQGYIAHDKNSAVMTLGTQYEVLGFVTGSDLPSASDLAPVEETPTRRIVHAPAGSPDQVTTVLSDDLRARRLASLTSDAPAARDQNPASAPMSMPDPPATPSQDGSAPEIVEVRPAPEPDAATAPEDSTPEPAVPETAEPVAAEPVALADEAPTQLITRIKD
ncbi:hypothetical protein [Nocardia aurantiaca]|uniref:Uncharacterized protein n=1 Tax=Nocardia aurantiaca TaxID=2675850 RepID=A0A6I3KW16_9NOCA|nr:hypothetical protein [Nocardia aurantiaca]MTE13611.1 hypothetical protein [Nocardia aurantiaca]